MQTPRIRSAWYGTSIKRLALYAVLFWTCVYLVRCLIQFVEGAAKAVAA